MMISEMLKLRDACIGPNPSKKLDMGKGCVRFRKLEDLALDVRFAGRELYGRRPRAVANWSREAGDTVLVNGAKGMSDMAG